MSLKVHGNILLTKDYIKERIDYSNGYWIYLDAGRRDSYPRSGTNWYDLSMVNNTGILVNGPTFSENNGGNFSFNGSNTYVDTGFVHNNNSSLTMSCWMKTSVTNQLCALMGIYGSINYQLQLWISGNNIGTVAGNYILLSHFSSLPFANRTIFLNTQSITDGNWKFITVTSDASVSKVYINGVLAATSSVTTAPTMGIATLKIGGNSSSGYYNGQISYASFYNDAQTGAQILENFNALRYRYGI